MRILFAIRSDKISVFALSALLFLSCSQNIDVKGIQSITSREYRFQRGDILIDIFSGRPNPFCPMSDLALQRLSETLLLLPTSNESANQIKPSLGYRGIVLSLQQGNTTFTLNAYMGDITITSSSYAQKLTLYDEKKSIEIQMLKECQAHNPQDLFYDDLIVNLQEK